jgi:hypothetical protein
MALGNPEGSVMAQEAALTYSVSPNGPAGDWYWEVACGGDIVARGLAAKPVQARADAIRSARAFHADGVTARSHATPWSHRTLSE